jgi:hypothetical protein
MVDTEAADNVHPGAICNIQQTPIDGSRYFAFTKINGDEVKFNLSEKAILQPNIYDINPLIYYRIKRPLKKSSKLPMLDLKQYYKESAAHGLDITIQPIMEF